MDSDEGEFGLGSNNSIGDSAAEINKTSHKPIP